MVAQNVAIAERIAGLYLSYVLSITYMAATRHPYALILTVFIPDFGLLP